MYPVPRAVPVPVGIPVLAISVSKEVTHLPAAEVVDLHQLTQKTNKFPVRKTQHAFSLKQNIKDVITPTENFSLKTQSSIFFLQCSQFSYPHNLYECADLEGVKGGLHPPYPGKSTLVKFPLKIIENRIRPLPLSPDKHNINSLDPPSPRNYCGSAHVHEPQKKAISLYMHFFFATRCNVSLIYI